MANKITREQLARIKALQEKRGIQVVKKTRVKNPKGQRKVWVILDLEILIICSKLYKY